MRREKITIGVIGGSVSLGHGVDPEKRWQMFPFRWFKSSFPGLEVEIIHGAEGGRGSNYFMTCHTEYLPEDVDLVMVEMGITDWHSGPPNDA